MDDLIIIQINCQYFKMLTFYDTKPKEQDFYRIKLC